MAIVRQAPTCIFCGKVIARAIYRTQNPLLNPVVGDNFLQWEYKEHNCNDAKEAMENNLKSKQQMETTQENKVVYHPQKLKKMIDKALTSPALTWRSDRGGEDIYPANYRGRVPLIVKTAKDVTPDLPFLHKELSVKNDTKCLKDNEYYVWVNSYGAVSAILENGEMLGLLPSEFDVIKWHPEFKK